MKPTNSNLEFKNPITERLGGVTRRLSKIQMKSTIEQQGIIESVFVVDNTCYAIIRKIRGEWNEIGHLNHGLFNNHLEADEDVLSPTELLIPLINVDLSLGAVDPKTFIGKYATVSVTEGSRAIKAEYVGSIKDPSQSPLKVIQNALYNARLLAGATTKLTEEGSEARHFLKNVIDLSDEQMEAINWSLVEWKGKVVTLEGDAYYHKTTDAETEFELKIQAEDFIKNANETKMKTRNCHLPITIFSAR